MAGVLLLALLVVLSLVRGWDPRVGLRPRGFGGCGLVAEGFVGFWWCAGLWVAPWIWCQLGLQVVDGCCCGRGVGFGFILWVSVSGVVCWCGWVWSWVGVGVWGGLGSTKGQTVPDQ